MKLSVLTLLAAISEGKKKLLMDRYGATEEQLALIDDCDPTQTGTFAEWLTRSWLRDHEFHLPEDRDMVRRELGKFNRVKNRPEWTANHHSNQIMQYNRQQLREALESIQEIEEKPSNLPELSAEAIVLYQDPTYTLWKINNFEDAMKLSAPAGWCTKSENYAKNYTKEGALYPAYKDGEPFFQYHPGGPTTGRPQFMNKHNSTMQSVKVMNEEAYNLIKKGEANSHDANLAKVVDEFTAPNLSEAETLSYLQDVLKTNPDYAKGNKEFQELENKFVGARYKLFDEEELLNLLNKYPRTGDIVTKMLNENHAVRNLLTKIDTYDTFEAFCTAANKGDFNREEKTLIGKIPGVFSKVFALFSKSKDFDTRVASLKTLIKDKDNEKALELSQELTTDISNAFNTSYSYRNDSIRWNDADAQKASVRYMTIITNMVRTLMSSAISDIEAKAGEMELKELVQALDSTIAKIVNSAPHDRKLIEWCDKRKMEIVTPKAEQLVEMVTPEWSLEHMTIRFESVRKELNNFLHYSAPIFNILQTKERELVITKLESEFSKIPPDIDLAAKMEQGLKITNALDQNSNYRGSAVECMQRLLTPGIEAELAEINKLKAVTEKLESYEIPDWSWLTRLGEKRKGEIRFANEERQKGRQEGIERGEVKQRYAPKQEVQKWQTDIRNWTYADVETRGPVPTLSEKGFSFLMTSPSFNTGDKVQYIIACKKTGMEEWMLANAQLDSLMRYETEVRSNDPWPELEERVLRQGYTSHWAEQYKQEVYPTGPWPGLVEKFLATPSVTTLSSGRIRALVGFNYEMQNGAKWPELETRVAEYLNSANGNHALASYSAEREIFNPMLEYVRSSKKRLQSDLEDRLCNYETFATNYFFALIPRDRIKEILNKMDEEAKTKTKTSSHMNLFVVLMKELESL
jgi:hypothetical protein